MSGFYIKNVCHFQTSSGEGWRQRATRTSRIWCGPSSWAVESGLPRTVLGMLSITSRHGTWNIRLSHYAVFSELFSSQESVQQILAFTCAKEYFTHFVTVSWLSLLTRLSPTAKPKQIIKTDKTFFLSCFSVVRNTTVVIYFCYCPRNNKYLIIYIWYVRK